MCLWRHLLPACCCLLLAGCGKKPKVQAPEPPSYWIWHRSSTLTPKETADLHRAGVLRVFWQVAECEWKNGRWAVTKISSPQPESESLTVTPVFRIKPGAAFLMDPASASRFVDEIRAWQGGLPSAEIQVDFDCPARLLGNYAAFLKTVGSGLAPSRISITALASWPGEPQFKKLATTVSALYPMFYDLEEDTPADVMAFRFQPIASRSVASWLKKWEDCPTPWFAGLPNFERVSLFSRTGKLIGHLRGWEPDAVFFHPYLTGKSLGNGVTLFSIDQPCRLNEYHLFPDQYLVHRMPDREILQWMGEAALRHHASGLIYFALPGPGIQATYTPIHLSSPHATVDLTLEVSGNGSVVLTNKGPADLPDGFWTLTLKGQSGGDFRSASPQEFPRLSTPEDMPAEMATTLYLHFSRLRAEDSLKSGALLSHPEKVLWSIPNLIPERPIRDK